MGYYFGRKDGLFLNIKQNFAIVTAGVLLVSSGITTLPENNFSTCILRAAAEDTATSGSCGTKDSNLTWELDEAGTLTIRGDGMMADWSEKSAPWYPIRDEITSVVIEDGVSHIGTYAFQNCKELKGIEITDDVTSIGASAFQRCRSLEAIDLPDHVSKIGSYAFSQCDALTEIIIPESITELEDGVFYNSIRLEKIEIPTSVTEIGNCVFFYTPWVAAQKKENPLVIVNNILVDGQAYQGHAVIPEGVRSIAGYAFYYSVRITAVTMPSTITEIGDDAFRSCRNLTSVSFSENITSIGDRAFLETPKRPE